VRVAWLVPVLFAFAFIAAARCGTAPQPTSGVEGNVTIGPMCPVERPESPCPDQPYAAKLLIKNADSGRVATTHSGEDGRFRIALKPGNYTLVPQSPDGAQLPYGSPQDFEVHDGAYTHVDVHYDSGIR